MNCKYCGNKLSDKANFCRRCGKKVEPIIPAPVLKQDDRHADGKTKSGIGAPLKIALFIGACLAVIIAGVIVINLLLPINLNRYITVEFNGEDGAGYAFAFFDGEKFKKDYGRRLEFNLSEEDYLLVQLFEIEPCDLILDNLDYDITPSSKLSNGDTVTLIWDFDEDDKEDLNSSFNYKFSFKDKKFKVKGLSAPEPTPAPTSEPTSAPTSAPAPVPTLTPSSMPVPTAAPAPTPIPAITSMPVNSPRPSANGAAELSPEASSYILPGSDTRYISRSELEQLSRVEISLARNELYARHGRRFKDETLQAYFDSKTWYRGTIKPENFTDDVFNGYEIYNRDLIVAYEKENYSAPQAGAYIPAAPEKTVVVPVPMNTSFRSVSYEVNRLDWSTSLYDANGDISTLENYYDLVIVTEDSYPYKDKINSTLNTHSGKFLQGGIQDFSEIVPPSSYGPYVNTSELFEIYNGSSILSIKEDRSFYMGGVFDTGHDCFVFDLATGELLTLPEFLGLSSEAVTALVQRAVAEDETFGQFPDFYTRYFQSTSPADFSFYVSGDGEIMVSFNEYEIGPGYAGAPAFCIGNISNYR